MFSERYISVFDSSIVEELYFEQEFIPENNLKELHQEDYFSDGEKFPKVEETCNGEFIFS